MAVSAIVDAGMQDAAVRRGRLAARQEPEYDVKLCAA
jgi:hypothetical protein